MLLRIFQITNAIFFKPYLFVFHIRVFIVCYHLYFEEKLVMYQVTFFDFPFVVTRVTLRLDSNKNHTM